MTKSNRPSRREFLEVATAGMGLALAGPDSIWARGFPDALAPEAGAPEQAQIGTGSPGGGVNPFTDPSYAAGAKMRLQEFLGRGADPSEAKAIFARLTSLDPEAWVKEWTKLAVPAEHQAAETS